MKTLLIVLAMAAMSFAQMTPDGYIGGFSLHITPTLEFGSADYNVDGDVFNEYFTNLNYPTRLSINIMVVAPVSSQMSISINYNYHPMFMWMMRLDETQDPYYNLFASDRITGHTSKLSATISIYFGSK